MRLLKLVLALMLSAVMAFAATTGKMAGYVSDASTGEPLIGANVLLEGSTLGAATDGDGYFAILNVAPGLYRVSASYIGYKTLTVTDVEVFIDLTTELEFRMETSAFQGETVTVVAEKKAFQKDVAGTQLNVSSEQLEVLPVNTVSDVLSLNAGMSGLSVRGGGSDETLFMVDGVTQRDSRTNEPISEVPLSAIENISVQTGGLSAQYSNVRSGVVNVVTREGDPGHYAATVSVKYSPPAAKHFGISPYDPDSYWLRPYLDEEVCWEGTDNGAWDKWTLMDYAGNEFIGGWNAVSQSTLTDNDPNNDISAAAAKRIFEWEHRRYGYIEEPDMNIDLGFGGPVPVLSALGNTRFWASYYQNDNYYVIPLATDGIFKRSGMLKVTSDLSEKTKLSLTSNIGTTNATSASRTGSTSLFVSSWGIANTIDRSGFTVPSRIFITDYWSGTSVVSNSLSAKLTHMVSSDEYFTVQTSRVAKTYETGPGSLRDTSRVNEIMPGIFVDEAPFGFWPSTANGIDGLFMGGTIATGRDSSRVTSYMFRYDHTNQINRYNQLQYGVNFNLDVLDLEFGSVAELPDGNYWTSFNENPWRFNAYIQDKLEFQELTTTLGLTADYINPNSKWYSPGGGVYDPDFFSSNFSEADDSIKVDTDAQLFLSPRVGISHPFSENAKLFFNYGHYVQMPTSEQLFRLDRYASNQVRYMGDPSLTLARTISYEIGFDQSLLNNYLLHVSAYYKDITDQQDWTRYINIQGNVNYYQLTANSYEDIRGFEIELAKLSGRWITGKVNYEYRVNTYGEFGYGVYYENPQEQRTYELNNPSESKPLPQPRAKSYVDLHTPMDFGRRMTGTGLLSDWHLTAIGEWTSGGWFTWNPNQATNERGAVISSNVRWKDYYNVDLKLSKSFQFADRFNLKFFVDMNNALNIKTFSGVSFYDVFDYYDYMYSLHLPQEIGDELNYGNIPGEDRPGTVRPEDVDYVHVESRAVIDASVKGDVGALYFSRDDETYYSYDGTAWSEADQDFVDQVLEDKAYINMPNLSSFTFLNPRDIFIGINISFDLGK